MDQVSKSSSTHALHNKFWMEKENVMLLLGSKVVLGSHLCIGCHF